MTPAMIDAPAPATKRLMDWTRFARRGKAVLREIRRIEAAGTPRTFDERRDTKRRIRMLRREARWSCTAAARLILVRKGMPVRGVATR